MQVERDTPWYTVVYRTGGVINYQWHHTQPFSAIAIDDPRIDIEVELVERQGHTAFAIDTRILKALGVPTKFNGTWT